MKRLEDVCARMSKSEVIAQSYFSRSQIHQWENGIQLDRKEREPQLIPQESVEKAVEVIRTYPHFGGRKGQAFMLYHELGFIGEKRYDAIRSDVGRTFLWELGHRKLLESPGAYEHIRPERIGEIWSEDFTDLTVKGVTFRVALLKDVYHHYYLGAAVAQRATAALVQRPVDQALRLTGGQGPSLFLLSDNGSQYISEAHQELLSSLEIIQRRIPACKPQYNGAIEGGMRDFKSFFYNVWERLLKELSAADKEKSLPELVQLAVEETVWLLNEVIPRPSLGGVTPADVQHGRQGAKRQDIEAYRDAQMARRDVPPWDRDYWEILRSGLRLDEMSDDELLTKAAFFGRRPLRRIAQRNRECVG